MHSVTRVKRFFYFILFFGVLDGHVLGVDLWVTLRTEPSQPPALEICRVEIDVNSSPYGNKSSELSHLFLGGPVDLRTSQ